MLKNFIKIAYRNLLKQKGYSFINITGLALGLACTMILLLFIESESSYDQFHENSDRIIRVNSFGSVAGREFKSVTSALPLYRALMNDYPEVIKATRINAITAQSFYYQNEQHEVKDWFFAEEELFEVLSFQRTQGVLKLSTPNDIVIAESIAQSFFGSKNPIGETINLDNNEGKALSIVGVFKDFPIESHIHPKWIASYRSYWRFSQDKIWLGFNTNTYALLEKGIRLEDFNKKFPALVEKYMGNDMRRFGATISMSGQYLNDLHLQSNHLESHIEQPGSINNIYIMSIIALFIILIASINFMNLSTARSSKRAKEVGMRKVLGAQPSNLVFQFLGESIFISLISLFIAFSLVEIFLPMFNNLANRSIEFNFLEDINMVSMFFALTILVGILSGLYPSFYLSSFSPIHTLKGEISRSGSALFIRRSLVILQFTISIAMIIGTFLIIDQIDFMQNKKLGFDKDQLVAIHIPNSNVEKNYAALNQKLKQVNGVLNVTAANDYPGDGSTNNSVYRAEGQAESESSLLDHARANHDYFETMGITLLKGRYFSRDYPSDREESVILNESAVKKFGFTIENATTKKIYAFRTNSEMQLMNVVGVVKDFHYKSLKEQIRPVVFRLRDDLAETVIARVNMKNIKETLLSLEATFNEVNPNDAFEYEFISAKFSKFYTEEQRFSSIINAFTFIAIFIACLGLFGLASFMADQKVKEIGIRKVLGASLFNIINIFSGEFGKLIVISIILSIPISFYIINEWLSHFAYRIEIGAMPFIFASLISIVITMITIGYQAYKAAKNDPIIALKYE